jgi:hypothetical protein
MRSDLEEIVNEYLREVLGVLGTEANRNIEYSLVDVADTSVSVNGVVRVDNAHGDAHIEIRLTRRQPERPSRFTLQAITRDLAPATGFSGFIAQGTLSSPSGVEMLGRINTYNVFDWEKKLGGK